ncbi:MAG: nitroreductase family protein [Promethearchaeota archaeon]
MRFNKSIIEIIKERTSRRTYVPKLLDEDLREHIRDILKVEEVKSPYSEMAGKCRFKLIAVPEFDPNERKKLGTYGLIKGAQEFIVGAVEKSDYMKEHFGYLMEYIVLAATDLGLGTCWLGGFFNRSLFSEKFGIMANEFIPAISPIGYPEKRRIREVLIRQAVNANHRHPWDRLFYEGDFSKPMSSEIDDNYNTMLKMVQLGPSAGNNQPWRIIKAPDKNEFHFFTIKTKGVYKRFQPLDIGIAICHWDLTSQELGVKGKWEINHPNIPGSEDFDYIISWKEE